WKNGLLVSMLPLVLKVLMMPLESGMGCRFGIGVGAGVGVALGLAVVAASRAASAAVTFGVADRTGAVADRPAAAPADGTAVALPLTRAVALVLGVPETAAVADGEAVDNAEAVLVGDAIAEGVRLSAPGGEDVAVAVLAQVRRSPAAMPAARCREDLLVNGKFISRLWTSQCDSLWPSCGAGGLLVVRNVTDL
ncbi:MAG TPA: hypothetical protein VKU60_13140, partial [Chloroflexota bacterium]|nr:hypothetical protein [Chloroflexota bacterium]